MLTAILILQVINLNLLKSTAKGGKKESDLISEPKVGLGTANMDESLSDDSNEAAEASKLSRANPSTSLSPSTSSSLASQSGAVDNVTFNMGSNVAIGTEGVLLKNTPSGTSTNMGATGPAIGSSSLVSDNTGATGPAIGSSSLVSDKDETITNPISGALSGLGETITKAKEEHEAAKRLSQSQTSENLNSETLGSSLTSQTEAVDNVTFNMTSNVAIGTGGVLIENAGKDTAANTDAKGPAIGSSSLVSDKDDGAINGARSNLHSESARSNLHSEATGSNLHSESARSNLHSEATGSNLHSEATGSNLSETTTSSSSPFSMVTNIAVGGKGGASTGNKPSGTNSDSKTEGSAVGSSSLVEYESGTGSNINSKATDTVGGSTSYYESMIGSSLSETTKSGSSPFSMVTNIAVGGDGGVSTDNKPDSTNSESKTGGSAVGSSSLVESEAGSNLSETSKSGSSSFSMVTNIAVGGDGGVGTENKPDSTNSGSKTSGPAVGSSSLVDSEAGFELHSQWQ